MCDPGHKALDGHETRGHGGRQAGWMGPAQNPQKCHPEFAEPMDMRCRVAPSRTAWARLSAVVVTPVDKMMFAPTGIGEARD